MKNQKGRLLGTDDEERTATFVLTTESVDRDGETVNPDGGDFEDYEKNPVVAFNHDTDDFPIGRCIKIWNQEIDGRPALLGKVQFSKANPKGELAYQMTKEGTLGAASISFLPLTQPQKNRQGGNHYSKWKLLEFSICPIGSNPDAIKLCLKRFKGYYLKKNHSPADEEEYEGGHQNDHRFDPTTVRVPKACGGNDVEKVVAFLKSLISNEETNRYTKDEAQRLIEKLSQEFNVDPDNITPNGDDPDERELEKAINEMKAAKKSLMESFFRATGKRVGK